MSNFILGLFIITAFEFYFNFPVGGLIWQRIIMPVVDRCNDKFLNQEVSEKSDN